MWSEFEKVLKQNEAALRSGQRLPHKKLFAGEPQRLVDLDFQVVIITGDPIDFPIVGVHSAIGCYLQLPRSGRPDLSWDFHELVENAISHNFIRDHSIMAFLTPDGRFVGPDRAVKLAEPLI